MAHIGERIEDRLRDMGREFTQQWLAKELGIKTQRLNAWIKGRAEPNLTFVQAIADKLNVSSEWLLIGEHDPAKMPMTTAEEVRILPFVRSVDWFNSPSGETIVVPREMHSEGRFATQLADNRLYPLLWPGDLLVFASWSSGGQIGHIGIGKVEGALIAGIVTRMKDGNLGLRQLGERDAVPATAMYGFLVGMVREAAGERSTRYNPHGLKP